MTTCETTIETMFENTCETIVESLFESIVETTYKDIVESAIKPIFETTCEPISKKIPTKVNTLEKEIARLYRLGQKPSDYTASVTNEVMMTMFLTTKHKLKDPSQIDIIARYKEYGRLSKRLRTKSPVPDYLMWELNLKYDKKNRLIENNIDEYYSNFYWKLRNTIEANPHKKVVCPMNIGMIFPESEDVLGHLEMVVYDPVMNTLEHIDSNNIPKQQKRRFPCYFQCCEATEDIVRRCAEALPTVPLYINNNDIYSGYSWGVQSLECESDKLLEGEKEGYCLMWATLFGDLALSFPEYSAKEIVQAMMKKADSKFTKVDCMNDYLLYVVRGYAADVAKTLQVSFTDEDSKHEACIRLARGW